MIEQRALVELGVLDVGLQREQLPRHLEHVVDVAGFGGAAVGHVGQLVRLAEVLVLAVAAGGEGVVVDDAIPEERRGASVVRGRRHRHSARRADQLRHLRVAVQAVERVFAALSGSRTALCSNLYERFEPALVAGVGIKIGHHLVHAAELGARASAESAHRPSARGTLSAHAANLTPRRARSWLPVWR